MKVKLQDVLMALEDADNYYNELKKRVENYTDEDINFLIQ